MPLIFLSRSLAQARNVLNVVLRARCSAMTGGLGFLLSDRGPLARIKNSPRQLGMVEFDDGALIELFPCAGRPGLIEARNSGKSVIEVNHKIPFLVD
jgi:hypothetical protein